MGNEPVIDDRYRNSDKIYYDMEGQEFCKIGVEDQDVVLYTPDLEDVIFIYDDQEFDETDFVQVVDEAVNNPEYYIREFAHRLASGQLMDTITHSEQVSLRYALQATED